ncbi:transaldolase [uncultured Maribacter sp.]|uniref:transaldolase n=1 Tax=uncultured Maribacter sp. TaxID=431308 RepID=UPI0030EEDF39|tara:strand:- start:800 stop:2182 length:1383 start_codon:yes stop_codon:yes gene_type:complete
MTRILLSTIIVFLAGCSTAKKDSDTVLFAGEIVNPTSTQVILMKGRQKIDSVLLDEKNRFKFNLSSIENGLYHFNLSPEYQYVYLEKGDSLMVRLNTSYFDESLVFSGSSEELNNFLLELFLAAEEEDSAMYSEYYEFEPNDFLEKIKSLRNDKINRLNELKLETTMSEGGYELLKGSIDYTYNRYKEIYPFQHKRKTTEENLHDLPESFYSYRNELDYDNQNFTYLRPYYDFMKAHFGNLSYMSCVNDCKDGYSGAGKQLHFNKHKLHLIDSLVVDKELRDNLFRNVAFDYLLKRKDAPENAAVFLKEFKNVSKNNMHIEEIENLYQGIVNLQASKVIPNLNVVSFNNENKTLTEIAKDKKVLFYFWSGSNKKQYQEIFKRVAELKEKRPDHELIGINIKTDFNDWRVIIKTLQVDSSLQYQSNNYKELTKKLVLYPMNKAIITDNAVIVDGFSNIYYN